MDLVTNIETKMLRLIIGISLLFLIDSCSSNNLKEASGFQHLSAICIDLPSNQLSYYRIFDTYEDAGGNYLLGYNTSDSSLDLFAISDGSFIGTYALDEEGPESIQDVVGLYVARPGIAWMATMTDFIIYNYLKGETIVRYPLASMNDKYSLAKYAYFFDNHGELVALNDSTVLIQGGFFPLYDGHSNLHLAALNVNNGAIKDLSLGLPRWVNGANHFGGLNAIHYNVAGKELYYNFPFSDSLYHYDINSKRSLPADQLNSPLLPTVLTAYQGDASMESIISHSSASDFYMGFHHLKGRTTLKYRFSIMSKEGPPQSYKTQLELFKDDKLVAKEELCNWCKTRSFTIRDTIFLFREGPEESQLCFELITFKEQM